MALPIIDTPVLSGQDAKRFIDAMEKAKTIKISEEEKLRIRENFEKLNKIAKF